MSSSSIPAADDPQPTPFGTPGNPRPYPRLVFCASLGIAYTVCALGGMATAAAIPTWYLTLIKPAFNPPNWVFAPVWTILYTAMAISAWLAWRTRHSPCRTRGLRLYAVQLLLNLSWTWIFFTAHRPGAALLELVLLWIAIAFTTQTFAKMNRLAAGLMLPYLAWVSFAGYLNWAVWRLNG